MNEVKYLDSLRDSIVALDFAAVSKAAKEAMENGVNPNTAITEGMVPGTPIRVIREPYFGLLGEVVDLPPELQIIETGAHVRILRAKLADGRTVTIPRANVEIIEG